MNEQFMQQALYEAQAAFDADEVPVGAVLVKDGQIIARAHNRTTGNPLAHAELLVLQQGLTLLSDYLYGCTLYVTLEPCAMCAGAAIHARVSRIVYGAFDEKEGCCGSVVDFTDHWFHHSICSIGGVLEGPCRALLQRFFSDKRTQTKLHN